MKDAFNAYRKYAWMADEFKPVSDRGENGHDHRFIRHALFDEYIAAKSFVFHGENQCI